MRRRRRRSRAGGDGVRYTVRLRVDRFDLATRVAGLESDYEIADALGVHRSTVGRVLADELRPGPVFIAGALSAFKTMSFTDLFEVVEDR